MASLWRSIARGLLLATCLSCAPGGGPKAGGNTHWLAACLEDRDCGEHDCLCGTCTRRCSTDSACEGGREAACFDVRSPVLLERCESAVTQVGGGVCLPGCATDRDCGQGRTCTQGACLSTTVIDAGSASDLGAATAGGAAPGETDKPSVSSSEFADVPADVSWSDPIALPRPDPVLAGADERILGTWFEPDCDPSAMSTGATDGTGAWIPPRYDGCIRFAIEQSASGEVRGTVSFDRTYGEPLGPFAAPTDPEVGYPTEVDPTQYYMLHDSPPPHTPYRMLDGRFDGERLTFWFSTIDLWHEWCALQTPHAWLINGRTRYACVPQDPAERARIDEGKIVLCKSEDEELACRDDPADEDGRCYRPSFCTCDAAGCGANARAFPFATDLAFDGERLVGQARGQWGGYAMTLERAQ